MSVDVQLAWKCPHLTVEEHVLLGSDRRSLPCRQPVAGSSTVRILVNDEFFLPQSGLFTFATLKAAGSGPYDIPEGGGYAITVTTSAGTVTVPLSAGRYKAADILARLATVQGSNPIVEGAEENGHLVLVDTATVGFNSWVKVGDTAATSLGFGTVANQRQWGARGTQLYPAWRLHTRPDEITNRYPKFDEPVVTNPIFKVTYTVPPQRCLRCGSTYVENDYRFDEAGQTILVGNEDLLYQASLKILLTDRGSNPYHPWYGTSLRSRIGSKALSGVAALIQEDVRRALAKFQDLQTEQAKSQGVTYKERLYAVQAVNVQQHEQDPTTFLLDVTVQNASNEPIQLNVVFSVPGVVALMGSNGRFLGTETTGGV